MDKSTFLVDTKGFCYLCLQEICSEAKPETYSYRTLSRYLNLNFEKVYNCNITAAQYGKIIQKTEFIVSLCSGCHNLAGTFTDLYQELEVIKMRIAFSLQRMHDVMVQAGREKSRMTKCKEKMVTPNPVDIMQIGILENLRKETIEQCKQKLRTVLLRRPEVVIYRKEATSLRTPNSVAPPKTQNKRQRNRRIVVFSDSDEEDDLIELSPQTFVPLKGVKKQTPISESSITSTSTSDLNNRKSLKTSPSSEIPSMKPKTSKRPRSRSIEKYSVGHFDNEAFLDELFVKSKKNSLECDFCSKTFSETIKRSLHIVDEHCDKLFFLYKYKFPKFPEEDFKLIIKSALEDISGLKKNCPSPTFWSCSLCQESLDQLHSDSIVLMGHHHLIDKHFTEVCEKLAYLSKKTPDTIRLLIMPQPEPNLNKFFKCEACGADFKLKYHLRRHQLKSCNASTLKGPTTTREDPGVDETKSKRILNSKSFQFQDQYKNACDRRNRLLTAKRSSASTSKNGAASDLNITSNDKVSDVSPTSSPETPGDQVGNGSISEQAGSSEESSLLVGQSEKNSPQILSKETNTTETSDVIDQEGDDELIPFPTNVSSENVAEADDPLSLSITETQTNATNSPCKQDLLSNANNVSEHDGVIIKTENELHDMTLICDITNVFCSTINTGSPVKGEQNVEGINLAGVGDTPLDVEPQTVTGEVEQKFAVNGEGGTFPLNVNEPRLPMVGIFPDRDISSIANDNESNQEVKPHVQVPQVLTEAKSTSTEDSGDLNMIAENAKEGEKDHVNVDGHKETDVSQTVLESTENKTHHSADRNVI